MAGVAANLPSARAAAAATAACLSAFLERAAALPRKGMEERKDEWSVASVREGSVAESVGGGMYDEPEDAVEDDDEREAMRATEESEAVSPKVEGVLSERG